MALVIPFRAVRPQKKYAGEVASFPYDVLDREEGRAIVRDNPRNFLRVEKSEIDVPNEIRDNDPRVFARARENLRNFIGEGVLFQEEKPCLYVYRQKAAGREQYGLVGCVSVAEYEAGLIKKHELTRVDKENERVNHIETAGAQTGLVFLLYRSREAIDRILSGIVKGPPEYDFTTPDGVTHTAWVISERRHHRSTAAGILEGGEPLHCRRASPGGIGGHGRADETREEPGAQRDGGVQYLRGHPFLPRAAQDPGLQPCREGSAGDDRAGIPGPDRRDVRRHARISRNDRPSRPHQFGMYLQGTWYRLEAKPAIYETADLIGKLDVSILQDHLLGPVLGIKDPRTDDRIKFVGGIRGMDELERMVDQLGYAVAFSLYPPGIDDLVEIADAGMIMPPKSTWFEPKLRSGLFVHLID